MIMTATEVKERRRQAAKREAEAYMKAILDPIINRVAQVSIKHNWTKADSKMAQEVIEDLTG